MLSIKDLCNPPTPTEDQPPVALPLTQPKLEEMVHSRSASAPAQQYIFHHRLNTSPNHSDSEIQDAPKRKPRARFTLEEKWNIVQELKTYRMVQSQLAKKYNTSQENISRWNSALEGFSSLAEAKLHKTRVKHRVSVSPPLRAYPQLAGDIENSAMTLASLGRQRENHPRMREESP
ncbi:hypothetical protein EDD86DRAFT_1338 [Gorgonomyces haynaldii]|nr:hypothetical protein EDD86DRAFT_1338 [Gorgonomyces haynaldii]